MKQGSVGEPEIWRKLTGIFHEVFGRDDIVLTSDLSAKDIAGWDSFKQVEIIISVQSVFGVKFKSADIDEIRKVGDLVRLVAQKTG